MPSKTSQLQIRVTEEEKAALKRLARAAKLSLSEYVLTRALPSPQGRLFDAVDALTRTAPDGSDPLDELHALILATPVDGLGEVMGAPALERLSAIQQNHLAAMVEQSAALRGEAAPGWVAEIPPLPRPHFGWSLRSLQPHQLRVTPVPFKRRGVFFDPATRPALRGVGPVTGPGERPGRLASLAKVLASLELKAEFYLVGGAVLSQAFSVRPSTAHVSALFRGSEEVSEAVASLGEREGWGGAWLTEAVKESLQGGRPDRYFEAPSLAVFVPPPEYVLAVKIAALRLGEGARHLDDLRYLLRGLNLATPEAALQIAGRYFGPRHLPPAASDVLARLLAP